MTAAKKGLGRGFESLIPTDLLDDTFNPNSEFDPTAQQDEKVSTERTLPIAKLHANPDQPRRSFDQGALEELAASIKEYGMIQPIVVTPKGEGYEIVAGERRYRASKMAGLKEVPVIIRTLSDQNQLEISLIENIQRRDLNTIETAVAYAKLRDQFNLTSEAISKRVHKSPSAVVNTMRLLKLPKEVVSLIADGQLSEGQARPLIGQDPNLVVKLVPQIIAEEWSARKVEQYMVNVKNLRTEKEIVTASDAVEHQHEAQIEALRTKLGAKVDVRVNNKGAGKIVIGFRSADEFERIQKLLS
ncbi:MAG TPA: ParB/RepB/Spo0J family partition protein [Dongiaceae bacterium]|nr:ParB/RepB/Spo0J family partition protein [Dongiaceae bacterium]